VAGRFRSIEKSNELIENRTRVDSACSTVPQPTTLQHALPLSHTSMHISLRALDTQPNGISLNKIIT
jgi:hypothetical protein